MKKSLKSKLIASFGFCIVLSAMIVGLNYSSLQKLQKLYNKAVQSTVNMEVATDSQHIGEDLYMLIANAVINRDMAKMEKDWAAGKKEGLAKLTKVADAADTPVEHDNVRKAQEALDDIVLIFEQKMLPLMKKEPGVSRALIDLDARIDNKITAINVAMQMVAQSMSDENQEAAKEYHEVLTNTTESTLVLLLIGILSAIVISILTTRWIVHPLAEVTRAALEMEKGNYLVEVKHQSMDETGILASAFRSMSEQVKKRTVELQTSNERLLVEISERKLAEEKLRESELRYRSLVEDSPDAIVIHDGWKYLFANRAAASMLGATNAEDIVGRGVYFTIHPDYQNIVRELIDMISQGVTPPLREIKMLRLDGLAFDAETTGASVILEGMRVFQIIIHDISARKKADVEILKLGRELEIYAAQLEDTNKELEAFVYSVSHDLRAPLRTISGFAKILKEDYAEKFDTQGKDHVERVWNGSERMSRLIEDLLRLSKITRQEIDRMDFDLGKLAESVVENIRRTSPGQSVEVVLPRGLRAFVDPSLIRIAFENLFENAWKFSSKKENARIEFGTLEQDGKTVFFIKDNGAGFDMTYADKLFQPFHRLHSDTEFPGTGIGLSIVKRVIRRHGGTIWAEGRTGEGATIFFTLA